MDSSYRPSQVVTLELRSLEQRLNHGSISAGAMDEANEAMAKATQRGKRWEFGGKKVETPGENVGKNGKIGLGKGFLDGFERKVVEFGWRNREFQPGKTLDFRCSAKNFSQNA